MRSALFVTLAIGLPALLASPSHGGHDGMFRQDPARYAQKARDDADNTARNARDRNAKTLTPLDQSEKASDLEVTQRIRKSLVRDKTLSTNAKNVKIITVDGEVTLRGPVGSETERAKVVANAKRIAGADNVDDQLEIEASE